MTKNNDQFNSIDLVKGIGIIILIIYHFNNRIIPNGYLGMDMLFVISGYSIVNSAFKINSPNFKTFLYVIYIERIKKYIPSLLLFLLVISITYSFFRETNTNGAIYLGITSFFSFSNIALFLKSKQYFNSSALLNPFFHTWAISLNSQYYLLFPFIIWFSGYRNNKKNSYKNLLIAILVLTTTSYILFNLSHFKFPLGSFFLIQNRLWEFSLGSILFLIRKKDLFYSSIIKKTPTFFIFIFLILVLYLPDNLNNQLNSLIVLLTLLLITNYDSKKYIYKFLEKINFKEFGKLSYQLYLWHWGILSISRWTIGIHWWSIPLQVILIYYISYLSFEFVENPISEKSISLRNLGIVYKFLFAISFSFISIYFITKNKANNLFLGGIKAKFSKVSKKQSKEDLKNISNNKCHIVNSSLFINNFEKDNVSNKFFKSCFNYFDNKLPLLIFIGDHQNHNMSPISQLISKDNEINTFNLSKDNCLYPAQINLIDRNCYKVMNLTSNFLLKKEQNNNLIFIINSYLRSYFYEQGNLRKSFLLENNINDNRKYVMKNLENYINSLENILKRLEKNNSFIIVTAPLPNHPNFLLDLCKNYWFRPEFSRQKNCLVTSRIYLDNERKNIIMHLKELEKKNPNFLVYDPFEKFCDKDFCYTKNNDVYLYKDWQFLNNVGLNFLYQDFKEFLKEKNILLNRK